MGGLCPLFFDGAVCQFSELPRPNDREGIEKVYRLLDKMRNDNKVFLNYGVRKRHKKLHGWKKYLSFATHFKNKLNNK